MPNINEITRESWILGAFPEWGTWLNEEIDAEIVDPGTFKMWWIGNTGIWIKSEGGANISVDLWFGNGKRSQKQKEMVPGHQMRFITGGRLQQPNLRAIPITYDPFAVTQIDAVLSTHFHSDHIDPFFAAAVLKNVEGDIPFIGPKSSVDTWIGYGVPAERCKIVRPGDVIKIKDTEICVVDSFDRTALITKKGDLKGICPDDMDDMAVNYIIKTPAGSIYHGGDSHYSIYYAKHGKDHDIDVALGAYGENPVGNHDKMTSSDVLRMAEALQAKVVIPFHHDAWTNFKADPQEIVMLYNYRKYKRNYKFVPYVWDTGGKFTYPTDKDRVYYKYRPGFEDSFTDEQNLPYRSFL